MCRFTVRPLPWRATAVALLLVGPASVPRASEEPPPAAEEHRAAVGTPAPEWELTDATGAVHRLSDELAAGRVVFLDFWASWCTPCAEATPAVRGLHGRFAERGVAFYSVHCRDETDPRQAFASHGADWPLLLDGDGVALRYAVPTLPTFVIVDASGRIAYRGYGYAPGAEEKLAAAIERALDEPPHEP